MTSQFFVSAHAAAITKHGTPDIFNSDQGDHFTSQEFTSISEGVRVEVSIDGKGRATDNVYIE